MHTPIILAIFGCNYILSCLLFTYYRTIRLLTTDKELRSMLLPGWFNPVLAFKILLYIASAAYLLYQHHWLYLVAYTLFSLVVNTITPLPYTFIENLVVRSACKRRDRDSKLDIFLTLIGNSGK